MALLIDVQHADDERDSVHRAVQTLVEGGLVGFPSESTYVLAASGVCERGMERLAAVANSMGEPRLTLAVKSLADAQDYFPKLPPVGIRLARRCWPGPVAIAAPCTDADSLLGRLPGITAKVLAPDGFLYVWSPASRLISAAWRLLAGPIVVWPARFPSTDVSSTGLLAESSGKPLEAPQAKRAEMHDCITAEKLEEQCGRDCQLILDDGRCRLGQHFTVVKVVNSGWSIEFPGVVPTKTVSSMAVAMILFVCTGNTCRSPMAESIAKKLLAEKLACSPTELESRGVVVRSAGLAAANNAPASAESCQIMEEQGLDLSDHASQPLGGGLVKQADWIFTMTRSHRDLLLAAYPDAADRTMVLRRDGLDVVDPIGSPLEDYRRCAEQIQKEVQAWLESPALSGLGQMGTQG